MLACIATRAIVSDRCLEQIPLPILNRSSAIVFVARGSPTFRVAGTLRPTSSKELLELAGSARRSSRFAFDRLAAIAIIRFWSPRSRANPRHLSCDYRPASRTCAEAVCDRRECRRRCERALFRNRATSDGSGGDLARRRDATKWRSPRISARPRAHKFYERLGWTRTHFGYSLGLE